MDADHSVSLYVIITAFFMTFMMICSAYEIETKLVAGRLEAKLKRVFEVLCGRCYVRRGPGL